VPKSVVFDDVLPVEPVSSLHTHYLSGSPHSCDFYFYVQTKDDLQRGDWVTMADNGYVKKASSTYEQCIGVATHAAGGDDDFDRTVCVSTLQGLTPDEYAIAAAHKRRMDKRPSRDRLIQANDAPLPRYEREDVEGFSDPLQSALKNLSPEKQDDIASLRAHLPGLLRARTAMYRRL
jgi:hypothetical protein